MPLILILESLKEMIVPVVTTGFLNIMELPIHEKKQDQFINVFTHIEIEFNFQYKEKN